MQIHRLPLKTLNAIAGLCGRTRRPPHDAGQLERAAARDAADRRAMKFRSPTNAAAPASCHSQDAARHRCPGDRCAGEAAAVVPRSSCSHSCRTRSAMGQRNSGARNRVYRATTLEVRLRSTSPTTVRPPQPLPRATVSEYPSAAACVVRRRRRARGGSRAARTCASRASVHRSHAV